MCDDVRCWCEVCYKECFGSIGYGICYYLLYRWIDEFVWKFIIDLCGLGLEVFGWYSFCVLVYLKLSDFCYCIF